MNFLFIISVIILICIICYLTYIIINLRKEKFNALNSSKAKSMFMQKMSYEFRNLLNGILGYSEMLQSGYFGELTIQQSERINDIHLCGNQLQLLVKDFMDLSKCKHGNIELIKTNISLGQIIDCAVSDLKNKIKSNNADIVIDLAQYDINLNVDKIKLTQAFKSIIDNAIKFSRHDNTIIIRQMPSNDKYTTITISDTGIGINIYELDNIFLFPEDIKKAKNLNGLGMGMPLAKLVIELHEGQISVESKENLGTTVTVKLPK